MNIPAITTEDMIEVDRLMEEEFSIKLSQMMENAGRNLAVLARNRFLSGDPQGKRVLILAGSGGNGGGGLVAGRRLYQWGAEVTVYLSRNPEEMKGVPAHQLSILQRMQGIGIVPPAAGIEMPAADLLLDAILGYSLRGAPRGMAANLIEMAGGFIGPVLSLDVPSGMDASTGRAYRPHITAEATLTLALPKTGLVKEDVRDVVGELYVADIGVPPELYEELGIQVGPLFAKKEIIRIF